MGRYKEHEYFIYGFQKWGMTKFFLASKIIKDLYLNNDNAYLSLFSCHYYSLSYSKNIFETNASSPLSWLCQISFSYQEKFTKEVKED